MYYWQMVIVVGQQMESIGTAHIALLSNKIICMHNACHIIRFKYRNLCTNSSCVLLECGVTLNVT